MLYTACKNWNDSTTTYHLILPFSIATKLVCVIG
jgi:hypothetical protein